VAESTIKNVNLCSHHDQHTDHPIKIVGTEKSCWLLKFPVSKRFEHHLARAVYTQPLPANPLEI